MNRLRSVAILLLCATVLLTAQGCGKKREEAGPAPSPVVKGTTTETVRVGAIPDFIETVGTVRARNAAVLAARIPGTVTALYAREGDRVAKGQLLVTLQAVEAAAGAAGARAAVEEAQKGMEEAAARKELAEATFGRYQKLFAEQAVTRQEFEGRQMEREVAVQGLARAKAKLSEAREAARGAGATAGYRRISSPLSGIVTARGVDVGMTVFPGTALMTIEETGSYRIEAAVPEALISSVKPGDSVVVAIAGATVQPAGRVAEVVPAVDPASRTFVVKVDLQGKGLKSGMYGTVNFTAGTRQGILVPKAALVERGALSAVWVVDGANHARMRLVKTGRMVGERIEMLSGLSDGDRIVTTGAERVVDGAKVE